MNAVLVVGGRRGPSLRPMAAELTAQGIQTPRGGHWSACAVRMCCCGWRHAERDPCLSRAAPWLRRTPRRLGRATPLRMGSIDLAPPIPIFCSLRTFCCPFCYPRLPFPARLRSKVVISGRSTPVIGVSGRYVARRAMGDARKATRSCNWNKWRPSPRSPLTVVTTAD
jgi:hypothetical protein